MYYIPSSYAYIPNRTIHAQSTSRLNSSLEVLVSIDGPFQILFSVSSVPSKTTGCRLSQKRFNSDYFDEFSVIFVCSINL